MDNMDNTHNTTTPRPDPTELTTQMVMREISILDDKLMNAIEVRQREQEGIKELLEVKLVDTAQIREEKFRSIETQFALIEKQRVEQKLDTKQAVDAALIAQKEAVHEQTIASGLSIAKSETATAKQLDQLSVTMSTAIAGVTQTAIETKDNFNAALGDVKDRVSKIEAVRVGIQEQRTNTKDNLQSVYIVMGIIALVVSLVGTLVAHVLTQGI